MTLTYIIRIGRRLNEINNYFSLCAVFSALESAAIHRLKALWKRLNEHEKKIFENWKTIYSNSYNQRNLRNAMRNGLNKGACIPHIGLIMKDLSFIDEGYSNINSMREQINFAKSVRIADRINHMQEYQRIGYTSLKENLVMQRALLDEFEKLDNITDDEIRDISTLVREADQK